MECNVLSDEQETIVSPELEEPAIEQDTPEAETEEEISAEIEGEEGSEEADNLSEDDDDSEEFDWNGKKVRGPKGLKDGVLMHADYTRKTQALAEQARQFQAREQQLQQRYQQSDQELKAQATLVNLQGQLEEYSKLSDADWQKLEAEDFVSAQTHWRRFQQLQGNYQATAQQLQQLQSQRVAEWEKATEARLIETRDFAQKNIKGWSPELDAKLTDFAIKDLGFDVDTLKGAYTPAVYRALHLAWVGAQALNKQPAKPSKPKAEPLKVVAAKANPPARKSYADMDMDEYARARGYGRG